MQLIISFPFSCLIIKIERLEGIKNCTHVWFDYLCTYNRERYILVDMGGTSWGASWGLHYMPSMTWRSKLYTYLTILLLYNRSECVGFVGQDQLKASLEGMEIVVIPAGVPRKPGMTRDDLFNTNAGKNKVFTFSNNLFF